MKEYIMITMPAGRYYVGDLCYILHNEWDEVCSMVLGNNHVEGAFTLTDGRQFVMFSTAYGDGVYLGTDGFEYAVDSGTIGCITVPEDFMNPHPNLAQIKVYTEEFNCKLIGGVMTFGTLAIDTDPEDEDDDDYWRNEEEDEELEEDDGYEEDR